MKRKTILFFPVEPGIAHITRCLSIAEVLKKRRHRLVFAICEEKQSLFRQAQMEVVSVPIFLRDDFTKWIDTLKDSKQCLTSVQKELQVLEQFKPDAAVVDFRLTAILSTQILKIPCAFITGSGGLPYGCHIPNPGYPRWVKKLLQPLFQKAIWRAKQPYINALIQTGNSLGHHVSAADMFERMTYLIPEVEGYLPTTEKKHKRYYISPIFWNGFTRFIPPWLNKISPDGRTVYVTFGGTGLDGNKLLELSKLMVDRGLRVVVSASNIVPVSAFPKHARLFVTRYISGWDICRRVDVVVCHGGYGTMMQAVLSGKPVVAVPFNPDQIIHSLRFQELSLGKTVMNLDLVTLLRLKWEKLQLLASRVPNQRIVDAVSMIFLDYSRYQLTIERFRAVSDFSKGNEKAADIIEKIAS